MKYYWIFGTSISRQASIQLRGKLTINKQNLSNHYKKFTFQATTLPTLLKLTGTPIGGLLRQFLVMFRWSSGLSS